MNIYDAQQVIIDVLEECQQMSGREWVDLDSTSTPIGDLDGFDSLSGVEATVLIEERMGCKVDSNTIFVSEDGKKAMTIAEIAETLVTKVVKEAVK